MLKKIFNYLKKYLFVYENIIIFRCEKYKECNSIAIVKKVSYENLTDILYFQPQRYVEVFKNFLDIGDKGYFAYINDKCIHRSWVQLNEQIVYPHWASPYRLKQNEIFIHYCETAPEARGKCIYPAVLSKIVQEHILKDILIAVNDKNIESKRGVRKVGFSERERERILIVLGMKFIKRIVCDKSSPKNNNTCKDKINIKAIY